MKCHRIRMKPLGLSCYLYFDYKIFDKIHSDGSELEKDTTGASAGNGIWIDIKRDREEIIKTVIHEISHYLDFIFKDIFIVTEYTEITEIRARLHEYLYGEVMKIIDNVKE